MVGWEIRYQLSRDVEKKILSKLLCLIKGIWLSSRLMDLIAKTFHKLMRVDRVGVAMEER